MHIAQHKHLLYGIFPSPFGMCLIAATSNGVCHVSFPQEQEVEKVLTDLQILWPDCTLVRDDDAISLFAHAIFSGAEVRAVLPEKSTAFQKKVWGALRTIPFGTRVSYSAVARMIEQPTAVRAVASAIARNEISYLIPCHRVVSKSGVIHKYRWGSDVKKALLDFEGRKEQ